jgi:(p)ppGpp synthase/HD superfamily hydrolase
VFLPRAATGIDFAFVYDHMKAIRLKKIKINGEERPITTVLSNGQLVEPVYGATVLAKLYWLNHAKTSIAKYHIAQFLSGLPSEDLIRGGVGILKHELGKLGKKYKRSFSTKMKKAVADHYPEETFDDVLMSVGRGSIVSRDVVKLYLDLEKTFRKESYFWRTVDFFCEIYYSIFYFLSTRNRLHDNSYMIDVDIEALDRPGMLYDVLRVIRERNINVASLHVYSLRPSRNALYKLCLELPAYEMLSDIFDELIEADGVLKLTRK